MADIIWGCLKLRCCVVLTFPLEFLHWDWRVNPYDKILVGVGVVAVLRLLNRLEVVSFFCSEKG